MRVPSRSSVVVSLILFVFFLLTVLYGMAFREEAERKWIWQLSWVLYPWGSMGYVAAGDIFPAKAFLYLLFGVSEFPFYAFLFGSLVNRRLAALASMAIVLLLHVVGVAAAFAVVPMLLR